MDIEVKSCKRCGREFVRLKRHSTAQWNKRAYCSNRCAALKRDVSGGVIVAMYERGMSSSEIGSEVGLSGTHVLRILKACGATIRDPYAAHKIAANRPDTIAKMRTSATGRKLSENTKNKLRSVFGERHPLWKGGITKSAQGYLVHTRSKANAEAAGRAVHSVVAEQSIGRALRPGEHVHHIDHNKTNNAAENLQVLSASEHANLHTKDRENGKRLKQM